MLLAEMFDKIQCYGKILRHEINNQNRCTPQRESGHRLRWPGYDGRDSNETHGAQDTQNA
jgi:hypothetical protein